MQLQAFAKINLDLRVLGRRDDGYHEVRTILQTIDWSDEIRMEPADRFEFVEHGMDAGEDNLVVKAVRAFRTADGRDGPGADRAVQAHSIGAGLGGGSADAAVTMLGLQRFTARRSPQAGVLRVLGRPRVRHPFFMIGGRALGTGRGNEIRR